MNRDYKYLNKSSFVLNYAGVKFHLHETIKLACKLFADLEYDQEVITIAPHEDITASNMDEFFRVLHSVEPLLGGEKCQVENPSKVFYLAIYFQCDSVQKYLENVYKTKDFKGKQMAEEYQNLKGVMMMDLKIVMEKRLCDWLFTHDKKETNMICESLSKEATQSLLKAVIYRWKKDASFHSIAELMPAVISPDEVRQGTAATGRG